MQGCTYHVKIINSYRKQDSPVRDLQHFHGKFTSVLDMRVKIMEEFGVLVPSNITFSIGYFSHHNKKHYLCNADDLKVMYEDHFKKDIYLWCDARQKVDESGTPKSKRRKLSQREEKESFVDEIVHELKEKNDDFSEAQYRLWARMIVTGAHSSKDHPPQIPMFTGVHLKRKRASMASEESIITAAAAIAKAVTVASSQTTIVNSPQSQNPLSSRHVTTGVSPGRAADIRGKSYSQLSTLKGLLHNKS